MELKNFESVESGLLVEDYTLNVETFKGDLYIYVNLGTTYVLNTSDTMCKLTVFINGDSFDSSITLKTQFYQQFDPVRLVKLLDDKLCL